jgi:Ca-activated chloride channel family protein
MRSPVVLGVKRSAAERLGWVDKAVTVADMLAAAEAGNLRFAMTSATQSNSGASALFGFLHALSGTGEVLQAADLQNAQLLQRVRRLLRSVDRSSGSSGWLKETLVAHYDRFQAMFNYEALIIEANQELIAAGREPLYAVYPVDGLMIADSPLGYIDKGDAAKAKAFDQLQAGLLAEAAQSRILAAGRRTGMVGIDPGRVDTAVFNPEWGIDVQRIISPVPIPAEPVIQQALDLYQTSLRKPSCTAYAVDVSGSMQGQGIVDLKAALTTLLDETRARRYMLTPSADDIHILIPFNSRPLKVVKEIGNQPDRLGHLLAVVQGLQAGGGTDIYAAAAEGLRQIQRVENLDRYFPAVILMTDGKSKGTINDLLTAMQQTAMGGDIPIHSITFGKADETQLHEISQHTIGRVFHGGDLIKAFRKAKGYN